MHKPNFLIITANDPDDYLKVAEEMDMIKEILRTSKIKGKIGVDDRYNINLDKLDNLLTKYQEQDEKINFLHYSGHADEDFLRLSGGNANGEGLALLLKGIDIIFLNGCKSYGHVKHLHRVGVKAIIATNVPVDDSDAILFSKTFYKRLAAGTTLQDAFEKASGKLVARYKESGGFTRNRRSTQLYKTTRGLQLRRDLSEEDEVMWELHWSDEAIKDWSINDFGKEVKPIDEQFQKEKTAFHSDLIQRYDNRYQQKIDGRITLPLKFFYATEGSDQTYIELHFDESAKKPQPIRSELGTIFQQHKHLLITGAPGSGKTVLILDLALSLLHQTEVNQRLFPIIVNLAPWNESVDSNFMDWLTKYIRSGYGLSKEITQQMIQVNQMVFLFDGLDEVGKNTDNPNAIRTSCLKAIQRFISQYNILRFTICSRIAEYNATQNTAPVNAQIKINPLTYSQIKQGLQNAINLPDLAIGSRFVQNRYAAQRLLPLLTTHQAFRKTLNTPFYFNTALEVFDNPDAANTLPTDQKAIEKHLVTAFIEEKLTTTKNPKPKQFRKEKAVHYLAWLAHIMEKRSQVVFELADLQPFLLPKKWTFIIIYGLFYFILLSILFSPFVAFCISLLVVFTLEIFTVDYKFNEIFDSFWFKKIKKRSILKVLINGLFWGVFFSLIFNIYIGLFVFILSVIFESFLISLVYWFIRKFNSVPSYTYIEKPYQKISVGNPFSYLLISLLMCIILILKNHILVGVVTIIDIFRVSFLSILFGALIGFLSSIRTQHLLLRLLLAIKEFTPFHYVTFLGYCTNARILEQDGGHWRFRHQILQDYFAEVYEGKDDK